MRSYLTCLITPFLLCSLFANAQTDVSVLRKQFKNDQPGFREAWKHVSNGNSFADEKGVWFNDAYNEYLLALVYNSSNAELNYKTGVAALYSDHKEEAAGFFLKAIELNKDVAEDVLLLAGRSLQFAGRYSEAIEKLTEYQISDIRKTKKNVALTKEYLLQCNAALAVTKDTLRILIENAGSNINSVSDDYSEILPADGKSMFFASRRELPSGKRRSDTKFDENIFYTRLAGGSWEPSKIAGKELASKYCETPLYIDPTGNILYIYDGSSNNGDIKESVYKKGNWRSPAETPFHINTKGSETSFTINRAGDEIFFVSDHGKDNQGGKDIYSIKKLTARKWSKPQNIGTGVNTAYDEESVRISKSGDTLWFSSKGHNSIGGFDIFSATKDQSGNWGNVKNYGYPVNTPWDEIFYYPSIGDSSFYFVSNRSGGYGGLDIYTGKILPAKKIIVSLPKPKTDSVVKRDTIVIRDTIVVVKQPVAIVQQPPPVIAPVIQPESIVFLTGKVRDSETMQPVMAKIDLIDIITNEVIITTASSETDGTYKIKLPAKKSYKVDLHATGFLSDLRRIDVPENWPKEIYNLNIDLIKVKVGKKVVLKNILFETGKSILTNDSYTELGRLTNIMNENAQMKIEISGHTDKTGSEPINFKLSEDRAKAVLEFLVKQGIDRSRMESKGFGSLQPISDNATPAGRAKNRRVEFKILEF